MLCWERRIFFLCLGCDIVFSSPFLVSPLSSDNVTVWRRGEAPKFRRAVHVQAPCRLFRWILEHALGLVPLLTSLGLDIILGSGSDSENALGLVPLLPSLGQDIILGLITPF